MAVRYRVVLAVWLLTVVNYMERVVMGFAGPSVMRSLAIEPKTFGIILSSFALGYFLAQIPGGLIADRWGARRVLIVGPLFWALFTGLTGLVASVAALVVVRLCFGLSEGLSNAANYKAVADAYPPKERAGAIAVWVSAFAVTPATTGPLVGLLLGWFDWQLVFVMLAVPALAVAALNGVLLPRRTHAAATTTAETAPPLGTLLRQPSVWLIGGCFSLWNVAFWGFLGWIPSYLALERHIDIKSTGMLGGLPYLFGLVGLVVSGWLGVRRFHGHRPLLLAGTYLCACISVYLAYRADSLGACLVGLSAGGFFLYSALSTYGSVVLDLAPDNARAAYAGITSTIGQVGSVLAPGIIGYLVSETGSFASGFVFMSGALCAAALSALALARLRPAAQARPFASVGRA